jgi:hypothetical protein
MARRIRRDAWRKLAQKSTLGEQLDALEEIHRNLLEEVRAHGRRSAQVYQESLREIQRLGEALIRARKREALERMENDGDDNNDYGDV